MARTSDVPTRKLKPRSQVNRAKAALLTDSSRRQQHPIAELIRDRPAASVGIAALLGFLIVAVKPGKLLMRQVFMAGTGILLRKALAKYVSNR